VENSTIQAPIHGSQSARVSDVDGMANGPRHGGADSTPSVQQTKLGSPLGLDDLSTPIAELLKQLLSSLAAKGKGSEVLQESGNMRVIEEANQVPLDKTADIVESSV
jgi:hypothetical protein